MEDISELLGKILIACEVDSSNDRITFTVDNGDQYVLYHSQDCCEHVSIDDINGDLNDLVGTPITLAEEVTNEQFEQEWEAGFKKENEDDWSKKNPSGDYYPESHTWTFYKLATVKGYVDIRWFGESNGYYSESVSFGKLPLNSWD